MKGRGVLDGVAVPLFKQVKYWNVPDRPFGTALARFGRSDGLVNLAFPVRRGRLHHHSDVDHFTVDAP